MSEKTDRPYERLKRIFHEPHRLDIMSRLLGSEDGLIFNELKEECRLTDGNLSQHLKALEEAEAVWIEKSFIDNRPRTTIFLSREGRKHFMEYLEALKEVLEEAAGKVAAGREKDEVKFVPGKVKLADA